MNMLTLCHISSYEGDMYFADPAEFDDGWGGYGPRGFAFRIAARGKVGDSPMEVLEKLKLAVDKLEKGIENFCPKQMEIPLDEIHICQPQDMITA